MFGCLECTLLCTETSTDFFVFPLFLQMEELQATHDEYAVSQ
jgi:hypothetical protein